MADTPVISFVNTLPPTAIVGKPFEFLPTTQNGSGTQTWSVTTPVDGLSVDASNGNITGTLSKTGTVKIGVSVKDATGTASQTYSIHAVAPLTKVTPTLNSATAVGAHFELDLKVDGGVAPYTITSDLIPDGITKDDANIRLTGTPKEVINQTAHLTVTDAEGESVTVPYDFNIASTLVILGLEEVSGDDNTALIVGQDYELMLDISGGVAPYAVSSTAIPNGFTLDKTDGSVTGSPLVAGSSPVLFTVKDQSGQTATFNYTFVTTTNDLDATSVDSDSIVATLKAKLTAAAAGSSTNWVDVWASVGPLVLRGTMDTLKVPSDDALSAWFDLHKTIYASFNAADFATGIAQTTDSFFLQQLSVFHTAFHTSTNNEGWPYLDQLVRVCRNQYAVAYLRKKMLAMTN